MHKKGIMNMVGSVWPDATGAIEYYQLILHVGSGHFQRGEFCFTEVRMKAMKKKDQNFLIGEKFGLLTVKRVYRDENGKIRCDCVCDCGGEKFNVAKNNLLIGSVKSCGCLRRKRSHMLSRTRIYRIYVGMKQRCYNKTCVTYPKYGAKGIKICDEWIGNNGFLNFYEWAMSNGYTDKLTIDRVDPKKEYSPENCRWATYKEQNTHLSMPKSNKSGILGVSWSNSDKRWIATISIDNKTKRIGGFTTKEQAALARNKYIDENRLPHTKSVI